MKIEVKRGTSCFFVDDNLNTTNRLITMDKDRFLEVNEIFKWGEDNINHKPVPLMVVGFANIFPLIIEI